MFKSLVWLDPEKKSRRKRDSNLGPSALEADALTTRPTRQTDRQTDRQADRQTDYLQHDHWCSATLRLASQKWLASKGRPLSDDEDGVDLSDVDHDSDFGDNNNDKKSSAAVV